VLSQRKAENPTRKAFRQSVQTVARRMIRGMRWPVPEVWPSRPARWALALAVIAPRLGDAVMIHMRKEMDGQK
jgi:hypothetical protein